MRMLLLRLLLLRRHILRRILAVMRRWVTHRPFTSARWQQFGGISTEDAAAMKESQMFQR